jgi:hypothetical protein
LFGSHNLTHKPFALERATEMGVGALKGRGAPYPLPVLARRGHGPFLALRGAAEPAQLLAGLHGSPGTTYGDDGAARRAP